MEMKKIISVLLVIFLMMTLLVGCKEETQYQLYNDIDLDKYITVKNYVGITVDTASSEFAEYYASEFEYDVEMYSLYLEITDGAIENGDIINLDYEGKIDGVAFSGGSAEGASLTIGSGTFIDDFEEELIGAVVGEVRDVTATFPENYTNNTTLSGKEAIFTCTINNIYRVMTEEQAYETMGFASVQEYTDDINERAIRNYLLAYVAGNATVKKYPEADLQKMVDAIFDWYVDIYKADYNVDFEEFLNYSGYTIDTYKEELSNEIAPTMMTASMTVYAILKQEGLEISDEDISKQDTSQPVIAEYYAVQDVVLDFLYDNAIIK